VNAAELEVWNHRLAQVAEEMGLVLQRAAFSPNIKERRDYSCAVFDAAGRLVAQAAHIPVHLGSTPLAVRAVIANVATANLGDGEIAIVNDPYAGGTHLPDVTLVMRVGDLGWVANRAHHADVGGSAPGSMPVGARAVGDALPEADELPPAMGPQYRELARPSGTVAYRPVTIDEEGMRIAPRKLDAQAIAEFTRGARGSRERAGDLAAQRASLEVGRQRLEALASSGLADRMGALVGYTERLMRAEIARIPDGSYAFADSLDDDGAGASDIGLRVMLTIDGDRAIVDFSDCDDETSGSLNAVYAVTLSSVIYAFRLLLPEDAPTNEGLYAPIEVIAPEGTIVNARPPRAVAAGNVETSQRIVDVVLGALSQALPERIPAASAGTMTNLLLGGDDWAYYETIAGGAGAGPGGAGASAIQTHMTNTLNTPVEALEHALPLRVLRYARRRGSGGGGKARGGDGVVREFELLAPAEVTLIGERRRRPPYGLDGGGPGSLGEDRLTRGERTVKLPGKICFRAQPGDRLTVETPGGGGFGGGLDWGAIVSGDMERIRKANQS
jgi:N-methylhydantoinase B